jgi:microcin C transport system permease protein
MLSYFIRRLLLIIPTLIGCTMIVFLIMQLTPGGPFEQIMMQKQMQGTGEAGAGSGNGQNNSQIPEQAKDALKAYFDLDKPLPVRYVKWLGHLVQGNFGDSYVYNEPVLDVITERFPVSIYFGLIGFVLSYLVCIPLGIIKAVKHGSAFDFISSSIVFIGYSIPGWALGAVLLVILGGQLNLVPLGEFRSSNWDTLSTWDQILDQRHHTILPVLCYMVGGFATLTILMKNSLMENLGQDYVRTAFAKGLSERRVVVVHALRNSMIPIATGLGQVFSLILAGSFLIERAFNIDGMGMLGYNAVVRRDYTVMMGITVISVVLQLVGNIISDFLYAVFDPRIRFK